jgi:hypothetical protein
MKDWAERQSCKEVPAWPSVAAKSATASTARPTTASGPTRAASRGRWWSA